MNNVGDWPRRWARLRPHGLAVADERIRLDWRHFERRVALLAGELDRLGVAPGERVAILLANRSAYLELIFATARIGAIALPVNLRLAPREIAFLLDDCAPCALFFESDHESIVQRALAAAQHAPDHLLPVGGEPDEYEERLDRATTRLFARAVSPEDPMMLMYTSGTTGEPKGALLPHRKALYNSLNAQLYFGIRGDDRALVVAPLFHSLGLQILALPLLYCGGGVILQSRFEPDRVWQSVAREQIAYFGGVPTMHQRLEDSLRTASPGRYDTRSLRFVFTAGSAVSAELVRAFDSHGLPLVQGYGQTESSILCCLATDDALRKVGSVGRPVFHAELRIVDSARQGPPAKWRDVGPAESGEIVVRGPITMLGYWRRPEASEQALIDGWLCTGDLARRDEEGFVELIGRARDVIISGGENVYPAQVEAVYREHPSIREIAVVGVPDERWGEAGRAHVVLREGCALDPDQLESWARERLAAFELPREFVVERELPRTASGKVRKGELRD